jgi:SAM-dependent methyltransferase
MCTVISGGSTRGCRIKPERSSTSCTTTPHIRRGAWCLRSVVASAPKPSLWPSGAPTRGSYRLMSLLTRLAEAKRRTGRGDLANVEFTQADIFASPFKAASFDHVFVCFVLEHLSRPVEALLIVCGLLRPGGTITVIEGDHGSTCFYPDSAAAHAAIQCQVALQRNAGGNALRVDPHGRRASRIGRNDARAWFWRMSRRTAARPLSIGNNKPREGERVAVEGRRRA